MLAESALHDGKRAALLPPVTALPKSALLFVVGVVVI